MSHFIVYVILPLESTDPKADLDKLLQPYHEYECTGVDDEYVMWVDKDKEVRCAWAEKTATMLVAPDGRSESWYNDKFYRSPSLEERAKIGPIAGIGCGYGMSWTSKDWGDRLGYRTKIHFIPDGYTKIEVPMCESGVYASIEEFAKDWFGYELHEGRFMDYTNPNKKWNWWTVGGRWDGCIKQSRRVGTSADFPAFHRSKLSNNVEQVGVLLERILAGDMDARPFAIVTPEPLNGTGPQHQWFEHGEMGWFACVSDEKSDSAWTQQVADIYRAFKEHFAVAVDCHI